MFGNVDNFNTLIDHWKWFRVGAVFQLGVNIRSVRLEIRNYRNWYIL